MRFKLKALTDIWTGGVKDKEHLHLTGIRGSIRWWYEALVRAYGGYACDPTDKDHRCKLQHSDLRNRLKEHNNDLQKALNDLICPACQFFGCTGWSAKFALRITDASGKEITTSIKRGLLFELSFIPKKIFTETEENLLKKTIKLIVEYGAIGGRTVLKPSENKDKNKLSYRKKNHLDYGIIAYQDGYEIDRTGNLILKKPPDKNNYPDWPNLRYFWFIPGIYLNRLQINHMVGRNKNGKYLSATPFQIFLGGCTNMDCPDEIERMSKKIFSFHGEEPFDCQKTKRCFGYVRNSTELNKIQNKLQSILGKKINILTWEQIKSVL